MKRSKEIKITKKTKACVRERSVLLSSALNLEGREGESESDVGILHTNTGLETLT